jgi:hypothetical protein
MSFLYAIGAMMVLVTGASLTGQQEKLCNAMGGHYVPAPMGQDVCPDGSWVTLAKVYKESKTPAVQTKD